MSKRIKNLKLHDSTDHPIIFFQSHYLKFTTTVFFTAKGHLNFQTFNIIYITSYMNQRLKNNDIHERFIFINTSLILSNKIANTLTKLQAHNCPKKTRLYIMIYQFFLYINISPNKKAYIPSIPNCAVPKNICIASPYKLII